MDLYDDLVEEVNDVDVDNIGEKFTHETQQFMRNAQKSLMRLGVMLTDDNDDDDGDGDDDDAVLE